jgi:hypothetical protein
MSTNQFDASASLLGYLYQCRQALLLTIGKARIDPGIQVIIEKFDDVTFGDESGDIKERVQTKYHIGETRSLSDRSPDLWKTIRIWAEGIIAGEIDPTETLLSLVTTANAPSGSVAQMLRLYDRDEERALTLLTSIAASPPSAENAPGFAAFKQLSFAQKRALISAIYVHDVSASMHDTYEELQAQVVFAVERKYSGALLERLEGWWLKKVIRQLTSPQIQPILGQEVEAQILAIADQFRMDNLTIDFVLSEPPQGADPESDTRTFVHQLRLIALSSPRIADAILDYYRAFQQRSKWLREDQLLIPELEQYENRLIDEWRRKSNQIKEELPADPADDSVLQKAGRDLYNWMHDNADIPIRARCREPYVLRGTYHLLADTPPDAPRVGWHPDFAKRLQRLLAAPE